MSVLTESSEATYTGNSLTTSFPVPFPFTSASQLVVTLFTTNDEEVQDLGADYSVVGVSPSASVLLNAAPASGVGIRIERILPLTQPSTYPNSGPFYPETWEKALDRELMQIQQVDRQTKDNALAIQAVAEDLVETETELSARLSSELAILRNELDSAPGTTIDTRTVLLTGASVSRTLRNRFQELGYTPQDFGAVGDGVANDTVPLQNLIASGKQIYMPPGIYKHTTSIAFLKFVRFAPGASMLASGVGVTTTYGYGYEHFSGITSERELAGSTLIVNGAQLKLDGIFNLTKGNVAQNTPMGNQLEANGLVKAIGSLITDGVGGVALVSQHGIGIASVSMSAPYVVVNLSGSFPTANHWHPRPYSPNVNTGIFVQAKFPGSVTLMARALDTNALIGLHVAAVEINLEVLGNMAA